MLSDSFKNRKMDTRSQTQMSVNTPGDLLSDVSVLVVCVTVPKRTGDLYDATRSSDLWTV